VVASADLLECEAQPHRDLREFLSFEPMIVDDPIIPLGKLGSQFGHRGRDVLASFCHVEEIFRTPGAIGDEALSAEFPTSEPAPGAIPANQHVSD